MRWWFPLVALATALVATASLLLFVAPARAQNPDDEIIYIDANGVVRVFDYSVPTGNSEIVWFSPRGGYTLVTLIDSDRDGDLEIAAARPLENGTVIDIYDPVLTGDSFESDQVIGGIPWRFVNSISIPGQPALLATGNLDTSMPGAELLFVSADPGNPANQNFFMLRNVGGNGSRWDVRQLAITSRNWNSLALGDMNGDNIAEIGLASAASGTIEIWRVIGGTITERLYENPNLQRPWQHVAMGDWLGNGRMMLAAVRNAPAPYPALVIFRILDDGTIQDYHSEAFLPSMLDLWFGDVNGSGDDEVFILRTLPTTDTTRSRLFGRNRGSDTHTNLESPLDTDNGYRVGVAGDFDADGNDEVAVLRNNNLRIFTAPNTGSPSPVNETVSSDARNIVAGDLDRNGHIQVLELGASPETITANARSGDADPVTTTVRIVNDTNRTPVLIDARVVGSPGWVRLLGNSAVTTATLTLEFDAARLAPGTHRANLEVRSPSALVQNQPFVVPISFVVGNGLLVTPSAVAFQSDACAQQPPMNATVQLTAPPGTRYVASLVAAENLAQAAQDIALATDLNTPSSPDAPWPSSVDWLSATSPTGIAPEAISLTAVFTESAQLDSANAGLVIIATVNGVNTVRTVPITRLCVAQRVYTPLLLKQ